MNMLLSGSVFISLNYGKVGTVIACGVNTFITSKVQAAIGLHRAHHSPPGVEVEYSQHSCATVTSLLLT